jgi:thioredoxin-like negative regulator of GroEL
MIKVGDKEALNALLQQNRRVLVLFCASWCPFCRSFFSVFNKRVAKYSFDSTVRAYIDDDDNPLWEDYSIEAVPTIILFEQEQAIRRLDAELGEGLSEKQLAEWLAKL